MLEFRINKNDSGQKAEKFLLKATSAPSSLIYKAFRKKDVKVNGRWIREGYILNEGEELRIYISGEFLPQEKTLAASADIQVVYEDENIVVMDKPVGLRSQPDSSGDDALSERFKAYLVKTGAYDPNGENSFVPALCNRLDRYTGGLVTGAKNAAALRDMNEAIRERRVKKLYLCVTEGIPDPKQATLNAVIKKDPVLNKSFVGKEGKKVSLSYHVLKEMPGRALVEVELHTGRSHQIRAQLADIGCPLVGDVKYGADARGGQRLWAYKLMFNIDSGVLKYLNGKTIEIKPPEGFFK